MNLHYASEILIHIGEPAETMFIVQRGVVAKAGAGRNGNCKSIGNKYYIIVDILNGCGNNIGVKKAQRKLQKH